jgi:hypothetical protein
VAPARGRARARTPPGRRVTRASAHAARASTPRRSAAPQVELHAGGARERVDAASLPAYCEAVAAARAAEAGAQLAAIRAGLLQCRPARALTLLSASELERAACGSADVSVEALRARTRYGEGVGAHEPHVSHFWQAVTAFSAQERSAFLRFVWGRSRLPAGTAAWKDQWFRIHTMEAAAPDSRLPVAHTCFFSIELPRYSSARVCHQKLQYAVLNCVDIDADTSGEGVANAQLQRADSSDSADSDLRRA